MTQTTESNENQWLIHTRLPNKTLQAKLNEFDEEYARRLIRHVKLGGCYRISHFSVLNEKGTGQYAVNYHPFDETTKRDFPRIRHTRPAHEFFDGRFVFE